MSEAPLSSPDELAIAMAAAEGVAQDEEAAHVRESEGM